MLECERELFKLGVPVKTRHNEVAPGQYEVAPVFESANIAADHQQLLMVTLKRVAEKYGMVCLLHEKPFAGVNGSGKHVNFSLGNATQGNLLDPGETPHDNAQFLVFCARRDPRRAQVRRAAARRGRHRPPTTTASGANEAPPAIISIFLGEQLTDVFEQIRTRRRQVVQDEAARWTIGVDYAAAAAEGRGRPQPHQPVRLHAAIASSSAPWASSQSIAGPLVALNTIVAESLDFIATKLEAAIASGTKLNTAIQELLAEIIQQHGARHLQRRRLLGRVARGGREARPAEPTGPRSTPCPSCSRRASSTSSTSTRCCHRAS